MHNKKQAIIVCGLGYGDECKGSITDYLARHHAAHTVIRYNGGAQAAHNVVLSDGRQHTFSQFGSASFIPEVATHLSQFMLINPIGMLMEAEVLIRKGVHDIFARTTIDERAVIITPFHCSLNRLRELSRGANRHGSCGQGVGETAYDARVHPALTIRAGDLRDLDTFEKKLWRVQEFKARQFQVEDLARTIPESELARREIETLHSKCVIGPFMSWYAQFAAVAQIVPGYHIGGILARDGTVIFEGAQGVLLDQVHGFIPHVTSTNTTPLNAEDILCRNGYNGQTITYGLFRAYTTRHGHGPFVSEDEGLGALLPDTHNVMHEWQKGFRVGWFDLVATRYAIGVARKIDRLAVSCLDRLAPLHLPIKTCVQYACAGNRDPLGDSSLSPSDRTRLLTKCSPVYEVQKSSVVSDYLTYLERELGVPITLTSFGPTENDKVFV